MKNRPVYMARPRHACDECFHEFITNLRQPFPKWTKTNKALYDKKKSFTGEKQSHKSVVTNTQPNTEAISVFLVAFFIRTSPTSKVRKRTPFSLP